MTFAQLEDTICQWVYNSSKFKKNGKPNTHRRRIGLVVAEKVDGIIRFGWSKCSSNDKFNLDLAREIAYGRLITGTDSPLPASFKNFLPDFIMRCKKYYRVDEVMPFDVYVETSYWDNPRFNTDEDSSQCCDCDCADETEFYNSNDVVEG